MKKMSTSKWILSSFCCVLVLLLLLSTIAFCVDPFMQFRVRDNSYMLTEWYLSPGLVKNYDYDTLIVGSSMAQNFDMDTFRNALGATPLRIGLGGILPTEITQILNLSYETQKPDRIFIGIDLTTFKNEATNNRLPQYLFKDDILSRMRYLLNYEVWFRYLPVDIALVMADQVGIALPQKYSDQKSIDKLGDWSMDYPVWGESVVLKNYKTGQYSVSMTDSTDLLKKLTANIDIFFNECDFEKGEHIFFFPPVLLSFLGRTTKQRTIRYSAAGERVFYRKSHTAQCLRV